jgi:hypothetical protein
MRRYFTFGHGGYFSPPRYLHGGLPVRWARAGGVHWEVVAEPGFDTYEEASAPVFPLGGGAADVADYPGRTNRGFAFNGRAELGVRLGLLQAALSAGVLRAPQFQEVRGGIVLSFGGGDHAGAPASR